MSLVPLLLLSSLLPAADYRAGFGRVNITPPVPIVMDGYAGRKGPADGVEHDLWVKALAIEDGKRNRLVIAGIDIITLPAALAERVAGQAKEKYGLERRQILLNCSHTHSGPAIRQDSDSPDRKDTPENRVVDEYTRRLTGAVVEAIGKALADVRPANIEYASGEAGFGANRRKPTTAGIRLAYNPDGVVDHSVPVLRITAPGGEVRGILFGYACHNTTYGSDNLKISGDYAGFAQIELEKSHPGATALFLQLCGADQDPYPRLAPGLAAKHGIELAGAVERAMSGGMKKVSGPLRAAWRTVAIPFAPYSRATFEPRLKDSNRYRARHAARMIADIDSGRAVTSIPFPVHALRFGRSLTLLALGGETVADYSLRAHREFRGEPLIVAGYSNHVRCYVASARVIREGGYEAVESFYYDALPGPLDEKAEEVIFEGARGALRETGWKTGAKRR